MGEDIRLKSAAGEIGAYLATPAGTPKDIVDKLNREIVAIMREPAMLARQAELGFEVVANNGEEFQKFLTGEIGRWKNVIEVGKISAE